MFKQLLAQLPRAVNETFDPVFALLIQKDTRSCVSHRDKPPLRRHLNRDRSRFLSARCQNTEYALENSSNEFYEFFFNFSTLYRA